MIFILYGPGGAGKNTILEGIKDMLNLPELLSFTTRNMREGEKQGYPYNFIDKKEVDNIKTIEKIKRGENYYGVSEREYQKKLKQNNNLTVVLEKKGIEQFIKRFGKNNIITFYIYCSPQEAFSRMLKRGNSLIEAKKRLKRDIMNGEYRNHDIADYVIKNHDNELFSAIKMVKEYIILEKGE